MIRQNYNVHLLGWQSVLSQLDNSLSVVLASPRLGSVWSVVVDGETVATLYSIQMLYVYTLSTTPRIFPPRGVEDRNMDQSLPLLYLTTKLYPFSFKSGWC